MKLLLVFSSALAVVFAQGRPWYLGSDAVGYPGLSPRFNDDSATTTTPAINNRFDVPTEEIPIDARGDVDFIHRVNQWPRQNIPFWVLNADHIEAHRNTPPRGGNNPQNWPSRFGDQHDNNDYYADPYNYYPFGYDDFGNPVFQRY